jgi:VWFA-related protein
MKKTTVKSFIFLILILNLMIGHQALTEESEKDFQQQKKEEIPKPTYEVEVIVTNVHVVVTDKKGKRITGLKPENFEIYEDGLLQKLTNFYEVKGIEVYASVPEEERKEPSVPLQPIPKESAPLRNKIIIYFDNWHLHPMNRNWSIKRLESFIQNNFSPEDNDNEGMVVCLGQKLEVIQGFTSDEWQLRQAIKQVKKRTGQSLLRTKEKEDLRKELNRMVTETGTMDMFENYERAIGYARHYVEAEQNDLLYSLKSLSAFINYLTGIEGKKILIYVSDGLPINPGEEVFSFLDQAFARDRGRSEALNYDATRFFKELTARCNANEIALYPINAQGLESMVLSADKGAGWNIYTRGAGMVKARSRVMNDALRLMANDTGGLAVLNTNDIESGLKEIESDLQFYYSLGYMSPHREDDKYHSIQVKLKGVEEKYDVRVRHGYMLASAEKKVEEAVHSGLFLHRQYNPMKVMVQFMPLEPMPGSDKLRLTIKLLIPLKNLTLLPREEDYFGQIKVYFVLMDSKNSISPCHELTENIIIPTKDYEIALKRNYPYFAEMYVKEDNYIFSLAVKDTVGDTVNYIQFQKLIKEN